MSVCIPSTELLDVPAGFDYCASPICLSTGDVLGLEFTVVVGVVSALAVVTLLVYVAIHYINIIRLVANPPRLIEKNVDGLLINLFIAELVMSLGAILNMPWISKSQVSCGQMCNAQGAVQLVGETSVALFTLFVTISSFISVVRGTRFGAQMWIWGSIAVAVWTFAALWAGIGVTLDRFYAPTPYWCWISKKYRDERIAAEYFWLWLSGFGSVLLYTPLFLILRGNIVWDPAVGWNSLGWSWVVEAGEGHNEMAFVWYPIAYTITILPVSVIRWYTFSGNRIDEAASFVAVCIFNLSGAINVGLTLLMRPNVLLLDYALPRETDPQNNPLGPPADGDQPPFEMQRVVIEREPGIGGRNINPGVGR